MSKKWSLALMTFIGLWAVQDIVREHRQGEIHSHLYFELMVAILSLSWIFHLLRENFRKADRLGNLQIHIDQLSLEAQQWKDQNSRLIHGLSDSIQAQLLQWGLTAAEREIALLLLKGLSFKEIAEIRSTSEKTTRQQALMIYQKSKLPGRAELSAFFFEDLLTLKKS